MTRFALTLALLVATPALAQKDTDDTPSDPRVTRILDANDVIYSVESNGDYRMLYDTGDDRTQLVWISPLTHTVGAMEVREVFSYVLEIDSSAPLPAGWADKLLEYNSGYIFGAWSRDGERLAFSTKVDADATADDLLDMVSVVLSTADQVELELTGTDDW